MSEGQTSTSKPEILVTIAMSSGLLFKQGQQEQLSNGPAFKFVKALKAVSDEHEQKLFKVILINDKPSVFLTEAINKHELDKLITLLPVTEHQIVSELKRNNTHLYLSDEKKLKVKEALNEGIAAAFMFPLEKDMPVSGNQLRVAFDGVGVLFSNEQEQQNVQNPMNEGPFKGFLKLLIHLNRNHNHPIRTYLVTNQGAGSDGYRALNTLRTWGLELDEAVFLGETENGPTLERIKPDMFFTLHQTRFYSWRSGQCLKAWVP